MADRYVEVYSRKEPLVVGNADRGPVFSAPHLPNEIASRMRRQRVFALTNAAVRLSSVGRRTLALRVLARLLHVAPRSLLNPAPRGRVLRALLNVANPLAPIGPQSSAL
jgi:hypothetical protein